MANNPKSRRPRFRRAGNPPPLRLTDRDKEIIRAVHEFRVLRQSQIQVLFFGSRQTAQLRLSKLYHNRYLDRRAVRVLGGAASSPLLYILDERGAEVLRSEFGMDVRSPKKDKRLGVKFLEHTIDINTVRVAITVACREHGYEIANWHDDMTLSADYDRVSIPTSRGGSRTVPVTPDSYFSVRVPRGVTHFFLELDRGTMELRRFRRKIVTYLHYYASGGYERRYRTRSLRVLTVTTTQARLTNLKKTTREAGGHEPFYFTTLDQVAPGTVLHEPIWQVASGSRQISLVH